MNLGFETEKYIIAYEAGKYLKSVGLNKIEQYISVFPFSKDYRIWYDVENDICFSQAQFRNTIAGKDSHFNTDKKSFLNGDWGFSYCKKTADKWQFNKIHGNLYNDEIIYGRHPKIINNLDKSVLIIAGGPSVNNAKWENLKFDQIWSCNQYFLKYRFLTLTLQYL